MKNQELKEDLNLLGIMRLDIKGCRSYDVDKLWNWINQNYISKQQILNLECLKEESWINIRKILIDIQPDYRKEYRKKVIDYMDIRNRLRKEIKEEIKKL